MSKHDNDHLFVPMAVYLPQSLAKIIKDKAEQLGLPASRLVAYALDNEVEAPNPFFYSVELPEVIMVVNAYADEAEKLKRYIANFPGGISLDMLMLHRRDIGLDDRNTLLLAFRELYGNGSIIQVAPTGRRKFKNFKEDYKLWKIYVEPKEKPKRVAAKKDNTVPLDDI